MQTVKIRLRKPTRVFTFLSEDIPLTRDDDCIVRSDRGLEYGTCIVPPEPCPEHLRARYKMNVVRKITYNDESTYRQLQQDEARAKELCAKRIREHQLPMKLVDVEYTFDKHKVIFYFTAADRVDFRQLVRDLAQDLKTRIELRHIQVRDEAKITGGIGMCGRELCCSTWLREFKPISMKMAKRQNLSLNPSKISGQCGRLLCCLSYENEMYKERKRTEASEGVKRVEPEPEAYTEDAFGAAGAFSHSDIRPRPADWRERLEEMADEEFDESAVIEDEGAEDTDGGDQPPEPRPLPAMPSQDAPRPQSQAQPQAAAPGPDGGKRRGRRRRRRKRSDGSGSSRSGGGDSAS